MKRYDQGAARGNTLVRSRLGRQSSGSAGNGVKLNEIDRDTRFTVVALLARGLVPEEIAIKTGATLALVRLLQRVASGAQ